MQLEGAFQRGSKDKVGVGVLILAGVAISHDNLSCDNFSDDEFSSPLLRRY